VARSPNAQLAADQFHAIVATNGYGKADAWKGIARLLLTCDIWQSQGWTKLHDVVVYRESNDFKQGNAVVERAEKLTQYLASQLGVNRASLCSVVGRYWALTGILNSQPHNLVGHAFRSILVEALKLFGDPGISYEEEVDPYVEFPGHKFVTRSKNPKIDIVARRGKVTVALISARWRYRHDRVDLIDEALAYAGAAKRTNPHCNLYAWVGEFSPSRLQKVLEHCPPLNSSGALAATVHFNPKLLTDGLSENGRTVPLKSMDWLIGETFKWQ